ncbi:MAG: hypothetical protein J6A48_11740 [Clostridia bacterium]|nr:hypothetical protein [Clostridia bacterium]
MNTAPKKNPPVLDKELADVLKATPHRFWKKLTHNWGWKLLSLLLAVCLWAGLITQDPNLTRERRFTDVPISLTGQETLRRNGLIVLSGLEQETLKLESFRAQIPQRSYDSVTAANYNPRIDLSRITETGEQSVKVIFTTSSSYGTVEGASPDKFDIVVDEYVTNYRVPVTLNITGDYPSGYYAANPIVEPGTVTVSGPKPLVDQVAGVRANMDLSALSARAGTTRLALPLYYVDVNGDPIESNLLEAAIANTVLRTITVEQKLYDSKEVDVAASALTQGQPATGYRVTSITATPSTILAAGDPAALDAIEQIFTEAPVNVEGASETFTADIRLRKPSELVHLSSNTITVCVEIEPIPLTRTFNNVRIQVDQLPVELRSTLSQKDVNISVTGPMQTVKALRASHLRAFVDAAGLETGEHIIAVQVDVSSDEAHLLTSESDPATITLTLK